MEVERKTYRILSKQDGSCSRGTGREQLYQVADKQQKAVVDYGRSVIGQIVSDVRFTSNKISNDI